MKKLIKFLNEQIEARQLQMAPVKDEPVEQCNVSPEVLKLAQFINSCIHVVEDIETVEDVEAVVKELEAGKDELDTLAAEVVLHQRKCLKQEVEAFEQDEEFIAAIQQRLEQVQEKIQELQGEAAPEQAEVLNQAAEAVEELDATIKCICKDC